MVIFVSPGIHVRNPALPEPSRTPPQPRCPREAKQKAQLPRHGGGDSFDGEYSLTFYAPRRRSVTENHRPTTTRRRGGSKAFQALGISLTSISSRCPGSSWPSMMTSSARSRGVSWTITSSGGEVSSVRSSSDCVHQQNKKGKKKKRPVIVAVIQIEHILRFKSGVGADGSFAMVHDVVRSYGWHSHEQDKLDTHRRRSCHPKAAGQCAHVLWIRQA